MAIEWLLSGYRVAMEWLSSGHLAGVKQPVQISGSESLRIEVHVCVRVFAMRYQYSATCFFRETLKAIEYIGTFYLGALALLACPPRSFRALYRQSSESRTMCADGPSINQNRENAFALRLMDEILHHFEPSHAFILCFPLHPLALILVVSIC